MKLKEEISLVIARYTTKIIKEGNVDPSLTFQILEIFENKIDEIQKSFENREFYDNEGENTGHPVSSGIDMFYDKVKKMLK